MLVVTERLIFGQLRKETNFAKTCLLFKFIP